MNWIQKTMANMDKLIEASRLWKKHKDGEITLSATQKQEAYVNQSLERCMRCGDFHPLLFGPAGMATLCSPCTEDLQGHDRQVHGPTVLWFNQMVMKATEYKERR